MKTFCLFAVCLVTILLLSGCDGVLPFTHVVGSGHVETNDFALTGFSGVRAGAAFEVDISRADSYLVKVSADDNLWDVLDIRVTGGELTMGFEKGVSVNNITTLKVVITMPAFNSLDLSGDARASVKDFTAGNSMSFNASGASKVDVQNMKAGAVTLDVSGASELSGDITLTQGNFAVSGGGRLNLTGSGTGLTMDVSGDSKVNLKQLPVQDVRATVSGGAQAHVNTQKISSADVSGAGGLYYTGNPTLGKIEKSGGGTVAQE
jgi:hypothetical protein